MPQALEDCVKKRLASKDFYPGDKDRKSRAYAICQKQSKKSLPMRITKATVRDGAMYWQGVVSDDDWDRQKERLSLSIFDDFKYRLDAERQKADYEPPFVSLAHYRRLDDDAGVRGSVEDIWTQGHVFKAEGWFRDDPLSKRCFEVVRDELRRLKAGETVSNPVRFSLGFYSYREAMEGGRIVFLKGVLDHIALTRVPINERTEFTHIEEKSMTTKKEDALSIVGDDFTEDIDEIDARDRTEKADLEENLVTKAEDDSPLTREQDALLVGIFRKAGLEDDEILDEIWDNAYKKSLPNTAYAWIETCKGCEKSDGKRPQECRHLPYRAKGGKVSPERIRAALQVISGVRTGVPITKVPASVRQNLLKELKSCQGKGTQSTEEAYTEGRSDGFDVALDIDTDEEPKEARKAMTKKETQVSADLDAILEAVRAQKSTTEEVKAETTEVDQVDRHAGLLKELIAHEGYGRGEKIQAGQALLHSLAAHLKAQIDKSTPASPEDIAETINANLKAAVEDAVKPLADQMAVIMAHQEQGRPNAARSKALSSGIASGFAISPEESLAAARAGVEAGQKPPADKLRSMIRESVGLQGDQTPVIL